MRHTDAVFCLLAAATPVPTPSPRQAVAAGEWGGPHAHMQVTPEETRVQLDCARAVITGPLEVDKRTGRLDSSGSVVREDNGPGVETDAGEGEPARFSGRLTGKTLTLTVTLVGPAQDVGTFRLTQGRAGRLGKCR